MENPLTFLIADDEPAISMALEMFVSREFKDAIIYTAGDGTEAWRIAQNCMPDIILSDLSMPEMNGLELCHHIRAHAQMRDTYFIILTAHLGKDQRDEAMRSGANDFLTKPFSADDLLARLREAATILKKKFESASAENTDSNDSEVLKNLSTITESADKKNKANHNFLIDDYITLCSAIIRARVPDLDDALKETERITLWICEHLDELSGKEIHEISSAARISLIGKMFLNDTFLKTPITKDGLAAHEIMNHVPVSAANILSSVPQLEPIGKILHHLFENLDGTGFPDRLQAWQIPIGSRIIRVALDYVLLKRQGIQISSADVAQYLARDRKRIYESRIITLLLEYVETHHEEQPDLRRAVQLQELQEGMALAADIVTNSGLKLLPAGATLTQGTIAKMISHNTFDHIVGTIYIQDVLPIE